MKKAKLSWVENIGVLIEVGEEITHKFIVYKHDIGEQKDWWDGKKSCEDIFCQMPTSKQLSIIYDNKEKIDKLMIDHNGEALKDGWYWSSSEGVNSWAWRQRLSDGGVGSDRKDYSYSVRPVLAL